MDILRTTCLVLMGLLAWPACAQDKPLDLSVQPSTGFGAPDKAHGGAAPVASAPAGSATSSTLASSASDASTATAHPATASTTPGAYYGDTSGAIADSATNACDDAAYRKPRVHGTVETGVVAGNHASGNYQAGTVEISKPMGDCEHPKGSLDITVGAGQGHFSLPHGH